MTKANILIVEDDRIVAEDIKLSLKKLGFGISGIVPSGEEALKIVAMEHPDLVLMDIMLEGEMNGTETAGQIQSLFKVPVVYVTAYADEDVLARAKITEPFGYIVKPFEDIELKSAIEIALYKHKMETKLKESEAWLSTTLQSIGDAVIATDRKGCVKFINPVAESLTGWSLNEAGGRLLTDVFNIINEQTREDIENPVDKVIRKGTIVGLATHTILITKDGKEVPIDDSGAPIRDEEGNIIGVVLVFRDITERKQLEEQLRQSHKMEAVGTLTGGIAHDFNNILYMITGNAELAIEETPEWNPVRVNLEEIKAAGLRAAGIVKQLLSFSRKTDHELKPTGVIPVIKDILKFLRSTIPSFIEIHTNIQTSDVAILADPIQINQVLMNICINASHAMEERGGILKINVETITMKDGGINYYCDLSPGEYLKITVSDTGPGIDPEIIDRIFDPYFTTKEVGKGSGMGLAIIQGIIKNHSGAVTVDSKPGKGTSFSTFFPVVTEKPGVETEKIDELPLGKETILFVDDEKSIVYMTGQKLERLGYKVETKMDPSEALELFQSKPDQFDLVITDMTMPQMTGYNLSKKLKALRSDIPVIICTGHSSLIDEEKAKQMGISALVMKPISKQDIAKTIRKVLDDK